MILGQKGKKAHDEHKYAVCGLFFIEEYVVIFTSFRLDLRFSASFSKKLLRSVQFSL
jgi:hypothetical protein